MDAAKSAYDSVPRNEYTSTFPFSVLRGILIHAHFAETLNAAGPPFSAEVSYLGGYVGFNGMLGSSRADGVYGPKDKPLYIVELKSGFTLPPSRQIAKYRSNLPEVTQIC